MGYHAIRDIDVRDIDEDYKTNERLERYQRISIRYQAYVHKLYERSDEKWTLR
ncbi:MAG: hypothetical protein QXS54_08530 [Candidatus Methanomethylicaceae archaeon]